MTQVFPKKLVNEGVRYLLLGILLGILTKNIFYFFYSDNILGTFIPFAPQIGSISTEKFLLFRRLGFSDMWSIFLTNLSSVAIMIGYPYMGVRFKAGQKDIYINWFPKIVIFTIGFLSIGSLIPTIERINAFILFILYLIPHGPIELLALLLAYTIPREWVSNTHIPRKRLSLLGVLLFLSAYIETYISLGFADFIVNNLI